VAAGVRRSTRFRQEFGEKNVVAAKYVSFTDRAALERRDVA
jgi:hypothetical protein